MYIFEILKFLDEKIFIGKGIIGRKIKEKTLKMAEKELKKILSAYPSARNHMKERVSADDVDVFDKLITSRFIALAYVCLESNLSLLHKDYLENLLQFYLSMGKDINEYEDCSEFLKQMYYAKLEKAELREELMDDINFMIEIYENDVNNMIDREC